MLLEVIGSAAYPSLGRHQVCSFLAIGVPQYRTFQGLSLKVRKQHQEDIQTVEVMDSMREGQPLFQVEMRGHVHIVPIEVDATDSGYCHCCKGELIRVRPGDAWSK